MPKINRIGSRVGKLVVIDSAGSNAWGCALWVCQCDCGNKVTTDFRKVKSCGCLRLEGTRTTHGMSKSKEFKSWSGMIERCNNKNNHKYRIYGARGITVCARWIESFENFFEDMGKKPSPKHSIDRINNNGNYEPSNCRWSTNREQSINRNDNVFLEHDGIKLCLKDWAEKLGIPYQRIQKRILLGWNVEDCLFKEPRRWS